MTMLNRIAVRKDANGMASIGTSKFDVMGIKFDEPIDGNANDANTESGGAPGIVADPRDQTITELTAALVTANATIAGQRAALAAMLLAVPGSSTDAADEPAIVDTESPKTLDEMIAEDANKD